MKIVAYYIEAIRSRLLTFLAGPFRSEAAAQKYFEPTVNLHMALDPHAPWDEHSVTSINDYLKPGIYNDRLPIDPADLVPANDS